MIPGRDPTPRARESLRWLAGLAFLGLLAAGVAAAAVLLWRTVDVGRLFRPEESAVRWAPVSDPGLPPAPVSAPDSVFRVALLRSESSRAFFPAEGPGYDRQAERWLSLIDSLGGEARIVGEARDVDALDRGIPVVVPVAPCLPFETGMALFRHLREGGSVVAEGPLAARDADCRWRGWSVLRSLTGAEGVREVEPGRSLYLTVPADLPLSHGLVPGSRIELGHDLQVALETDAPGVYWSDWGLSPAPGPEDDGARLGALARETASGGRLAWFGFLASDALRESDRTRVRRLHESGLRWAVRQPLASLRAWPESRRAALVIAEDVEAEPDNARALAAVLRRHGLPGTFFVAPEVVEEDREIARAVTRAGEVGSHGVDRRPLAGASGDDQLLLLRRSRSRIEAWSGREVRGLRPPEERFDSVTLATWARVGGRYVAAVNEGRSASPELHPVGDGRDTVVLLPRVVKDDYNLVVSEERSWEEGLSILEGSLRKVHRLGGLALLGLHTQIVDLGRAERLGTTLDSVAGRMEWWAATAAEVSAWWRTRHASSLRLSVLGPDTLELELTAPPEAPLVDATVRVTPGAEPERWEPAPGTPGVRFARSTDDLEVVVDSVAAGDTIRFRLVPSRREEAPRSGGGP